MTSFRGIPPRGSGHARCSGQAAREVCMRHVRTVVVALAVTLGMGCSAVPPDAVQGVTEPLSGTAASQGRLVSPPPLPPTQGGAVPLACGFEPPPILTPANGSVLSGQVTISSPLVEGPCVNSATIVFMVANAAGTLVRTGCDNDLPARITWDTTQGPNGQYWITAQRACSCHPCAEYSYVGVTVAN